MTKELTKNKVSELETEILNIRNQYQELFEYSEDIITDHINDLKASGDYEDDMYLSHLIILRDVANDNRDATHELSKRSA